MASIKFQGNVIHTNGSLPQVGEVVPDFRLTTNDLNDVSLKDFKNKKKVLNIFPSIDTSVCAMSVRKFNKEASDLYNTVVLNISADLPFAQGRFCGVEGIKNAITLSSFRSSFARDYGLEIIDQALQGLCSRVVIVLDENDKVLYTEQVEEIASEPDYAKALKAIM